jgi:predicted nucleic acid-binding protein
MKLFIDTNVILDVLLHRDPHYEQSVRVWGFVESEKAQGFLAAVSFPTIYYIVRKAMGAQIAYKVLRAVRDVFHPVVCDERMISQAIDTHADDFEDTVQLLSAARAGAAFIITRNPAHFKNSNVTVLSPAEFIAAHARP